MTTTKSLYYAINGNGQSCLFTTYPVRDMHFRIWVGEVIGLFSAIVSQMEAEGLLALPALKWEDEPIKLKLEVIVDGDK